MFWRVRNIMAVVVGANRGALSVAETIKFANRGGFYYINNELAVALTEMFHEIAAEIMNLSPKPQKVIVLDRLFAGDDELKTNAALQMRGAGVGFRTI